MPNFNCHTIAIGLCALLTTSAVWAELDLIQPLQFGKIAITGNSSVSVTSVRRNGSQTSSNKILIIERGHPAIIQLSNYPAYTTLSLSASPPFYSGAAYPGTEQFAITAVDMPATVRTDPTGQVQFNLGGTLSTSGVGGVYYSNAVYEMYIDIEISF